MTSYEIEKQETFAKWLIQSTNEVNEEPESLFAEIDKESECCKKFEIICELKNLLVVTRNEDNKIQLTFHHERLGNRFSGKPKKDVALSGFITCPAPVAMAVEVVFKKSNARGVPSFEAFWKAPQKADLECLAPAAGNDKIKIRNFGIIPREFIPSVLERDEWSPIGLLTHAAEFVNRKLAWDDNTPKDDNPEEETIDGADSKGRLDDDTAPVEMVSFVSKEEIQRVGDRYYNLFLTLWAWSRTEIPANLDPVNLKACLGKDVGAWMEQVRNGCLLTQKPTKSRRPRTRARSSPTWQQG